MRTQHFFVEKIVAQSTKCIDSQESNQTWYDTKHSWVKGTQNYSNELQHPFPKGVNYKIVKVHKNQYNLAQNILG